MREAICCLRKGDRKKVLVFVHPISGSVIPYINMATSITEDITIYAICDPVSLGVEISANTIESKALIYAGLIDEVLTDVVPVFVGWSMGGLLALEIVRHYQQKNKPREVCMIDACLRIPARDKENTSHIQPLSLRHRLELFIKDFLSAKSISYNNMECSLENFDDCVMCLKLNYGFDLSSEQAKILYQIFKAFCSNTDALYTYNPKPFDAPVYHVIANIQSDNVKTDQPLWENTLTKSGVFSSLNEDHYSIIRKRECLLPAVKLVMQQNSVNVG